MLGVFLPLLLIMTVSTNERKKRKRKKRVESSERDTSSLALDPLDTSSVDPRSHEFYFERQSKRQQVCWMNALNNMFGFCKFTASMFSQQAERMDNTSWKPWREEMVMQFKKDKKIVKAKEVLAFENSLKLGLHGVKGGWSVNVIADFMEANTSFKLIRFAKSASGALHNDMIDNAINKPMLLLYCSGRRTSNFNHMS